MDSQTNTSPEKQNRLQAVAQEDQLDLEMSPVDRNIAGTEIEECNERLAINDEHINHLIAEIKVDALSALHDKAIELRDKELNFVTGLKMHLGIEDDLITLLFQPVLMTRPPSVIGEPFYSVIEGELFTYDSSLETFFTISTTRANVLTANYQSQIMIKHRTDAHPGSFIPNIDTESVIFPFQTIYALIYDNMAFSVFFFNSIRKEPVGGSYSIKHCLLLSTESLYSNGFEGKFANRSHLCPPSCNSVQYALAEI